MFKKYKIIIFLVMFYSNQLIASNGIKQICYDILTKLIIVGDNKLKAHANRLLFYFYYVYSNDPNKKRVTASVFKVFDLSPIYLEKTHNASDLKKEYQKMMDTFIFNLEKSGTFDQYTNRKSLAEQAEFEVLFSDFLQGNRLFGLIMSKFQSLTTDEKNKVFKMVLNFPSFQKMMRTIEINDRKSDYFQPERLAFERFTKDLGRLGFESSVTQDNLSKWKSAIDYDLRVTMHVAAEELYKLTPEYIAEEKRKLQEYSEKYTPPPKDVLDVDPESSRRAAQEAAAMPDIIHPSEYEMWNTIGDFLDQQGSLGRRKK